VFPVKPNAVPRSLDGVFGGLLARYGIWYARNEVVKVRQALEVLKTWVT
jgi:hypothetical protein